MDLDKQLASFIDAEDIKQVGDPKQQGFIIEDDRQADYIVKKIKEIRNQKEEVQAVAKKAIDDYTAKVQKFEETQLNPLTYQEEYLTKILEAYAIERLKGSKKKSIKLIEGTIGFHKKPILISYDEPIVMEFMKDHPDIGRKFTKTNISLDKMKIRKSGILDENNALTLDSVTIPGIVAEEQPDSFTIK